MFQTKRAKKKKSESLWSNIVKKYKEELDNLWKLVPELVEQALENQQKDESKYDLQHRQNQAKVEFTNAQTRKILIRMPLKIIKHWSRKSHVKSMI